VKTIKKKEHKTVLSNCNKLLVSLISLPNPGTKPEKTNDQIAGLVVKFVKFVNWQSRNSSALAAARCSNQKIQTSAIDSIDQTRWDGMLGCLRQ